MKAVTSVFFAVILCAAACIAVAAEPLPSNLDDIRNWRSGLPAVAHWNTGGHPPDWHVAQVRRGTRLIPTLKLELFVSMNRDKRGHYLGAVPRMSNDSKRFLQENALPISLRTDNIGTIALKVPRLPKVEASIPNSPVVWSRNPDGSVEDQGVPDYFADPKLWRKFGEMWGSTGYLREAQTLFPDVPFLLLADNNEILQKPEGYLQETLVKSDGISHAIWDQYGLTKKEYRENLDSLSIRIADFANNHDVNEFFGEFYRRKIDLYKNLFSGFDDTLTAWHGKMLTECYSGLATNGTGGDISYFDWYSHNKAIFDGGGPPAYVSRDNLSNFTSPAWFRFCQIIPALEQAEQRNPKSFREIFISISAAGATTGNAKEVHEKITPELYSAHLQWLLWSLKGVRRPFLLRYWTGNASKPTDVVCDSYTQQDYFDASAKAVNTICEDETLREFWLDGEPVVTGKHPTTEIRYFTYSVPPAFPKPEDPDNRWRLLEVDLNTPRTDYIVSPKSNSRGGYSPDVSIKVWGTAIKHKDRHLVHLWSPCRLEGTCKVTVPNVGTFEVPVPQPNRYFIVDPSGKEARELPIK